MKIPSLLRQKFQPIMRVDVFDYFTEKKTGQKDLKIGEAYSDGLQGQIKVLDASFADDLKEIFTQPQLVFVHGGGSGPGGIRVDGVPQTLAPFRRETLEHLIAYGLPNQNLRGVLTELN